MNDENKPSFGIGTLVYHPHFGTGRVVGYEGANYRIVFNGEGKLVSFGYEGMEAKELSSDPQLDLIKTAVKEVLLDHGWLDLESEISRRWLGGHVVLEPGKDGTQSKEIPMDVFFKKIIGVREKLRVLEQKINNHPSLNEEEKVELTGYITRSYGSLTSFNVLFADKASHFIGQSQKRVD